MRERDLGGLVDALLDEGEVEEAWSVAHENADWEPGLSQRLRLAEAREAQRPDQALPWYMLVVDELLIETGRRSYARAVPVLSALAALPRRQARPSGSRPKSRIFASSTVAAQRSSRCSTRPASADGPTRCGFPDLKRLATTQKPLLERHSGQADARSRTGDLLLTMQVLYQLSYVGADDQS